MVSFHYDSASLVLCCFMLLVVINNGWQIYLTRRQLKFCSRVVEPAEILDRVLSPESFKRVQDKELYLMEHNLWYLSVDMCLSCVELYYRLHLHLWRFVVWLDSDINDETWLGVTFAFFCTIYMALRYIPIFAYDRLVLDHYYDLGVDRSEKIPLLGMLCALIFAIVFAQTILAPLVSIVVFFKNMTGDFYFLYLWLLLFVCSALVLNFLGICSMLCYGKAEPLPPESELRRHIEQVASAGKFPISRVFILRTYHIRRGTATVHGACCFSRLMILDSVLSKWDTDESESERDYYRDGLPDVQVAALVAHALGHWHEWHAALKFLLYSGVALIAFAIFGVAQGSQLVFEAVGFKDTRPVVVLCTLMVLYIMPPYLSLARIVLGFFWRWMEFSAHQYAHRMGYGRQLAAALLNIFASFVRFPFVDPWYKIWHSSKPTIIESLAYLELLDERKSMDASKV